MSEVRYVRVSVLYVRENEKDVCVCVCVYEYVLRDRRHRLLLPR